MTEQDTILVIDDEAEIRRLVAASLTERGARVLQAKTAAEGLQIAAAENPDLYVLLQDITNAKVSDAAPMIREKFGSNYVFADAKENEDMFAKLLESGWVDMVYEDDEARILKIRDVKGDPPKDAVEDTPETDDEKQVLDAEENSGNVNSTSNANGEDEDNQ